ncbi:cytochrome c3 family protein [Enterovirga sp.]|uniref:cytochrome c3 family protein n=1 Tax=Enterovirga sp. TaxID=2026350 RepID=UPI0026275FEB|nr:cytochrome c3 family protein [Enterovirga sp.]MDB5590136.1 cytochrome [Enterovirga sp.]
MAPLFTRRATTRFRVSLALLVMGAAAVAALVFVWSRSDAAWRVGAPAPQPIPFQHSLHAGALGVECRFCHATVERAADAGMPSTGTCLTCHSQIWTGASVLEPLRTAAALGLPVVWSSTHRLPSHVYFHHGAHVAKGIGCATCHGPVETMAETAKAETLSMGWCLGCHRDAHPAGMARADTASAAVPGRLPAPTQPLSPLADCNTCHR